jgi:hypothetical protein
MYELRQATPADYDFLHDLHMATMEPDVTPVWGWDEQTQV